jgi:hypothetical protein
MLVERSSLGLCVRADINSRPLKMRGGIMAQANRYLGGFLLLSGHLSASNYPGSAKRVNNGRKEE